MNIPGIYVIHNIQNGKVYVGSTIDLNKRYAAHWNDLAANKHCNKKLQNSWNKYGRASFLFIPLGFVFNKVELVKCEQFYIDHFDAYATGLNGKPRVYSNLGMKMPDSAKEKVRIANLGKKQSPETIKLRTAGQIGKPRSLEMKLKMVATRRANSTYICKPETKEKLRALNLGKPKGNKNSI